jgi:type III pantothenate kinase
MNVVVDYGNTSAKVGIFENHALTQKHVFQEDDALKKFLENFSADHLIISSVTVDAALVAGWAQHFKKKFMLDHTLPLPVSNQYATPLTLGVDRIAGVCGARQLFPNMNCLVIDAGTCITYDFLDATAAYHGGSISPGLNMRFEAMHTFTARLPLVSPVDTPELTGNTTERSMQSGVIYGLLEEMDGIIRRYSEKFKDLKVILCGGDARFFENKLKASIFASPELVLIGLNSILIHNVIR